MGRSGARGGDATLWAASAVSLAAVVTLSLQPDPPQPAAVPMVDKIQHAAAYLVTTALLLLAACWRPGRGTGPLPRSAPWVTGALMALGLALEGLQARLPARNAEPLDVVANAVGIAVAWAVWAVARRAARDRWSRTPPVSRS